MKKIFSLAIMAVVMCLMASCGGSDTPGSVAKKCSEMMMDGNFKGIAEYMDFGDNADKAQIDAAISMLEAIGKEAIQEELSKKDGVKSIDIVEEKIDGEKATVVLKVTYGNGEEESQDVNMVLRDGKWKAKLF